MEANESTQLLTIDQLSEVLQVKKRTVYNYRQRGMPYITLSKQEIRYDLNEVMNWFKQKGK